MAKYAVGRWNHELQKDCVNGDSIEIIDIDTVDTGLVTAEGLPIQRIPPKVGFAIWRN